MCTYARSSSPASGSPTAAASIATTAAAAHTTRAHLGHLISAAPPSHPFLATGTRAWAVANLQFRRFLQPTNGDGTETSSPRAGRGSTLRWREGRDPASGNGGGGQWRSVSLGDIAARFWDGTRLGVSLLAVCLEAEGGDLNKNNLNLKRFQIINYRQNYFTRLTPFCIAIHSGEAADGASPLSVAKQFVRRHSQWRSRRSCVATLSGEAGVRPSPLSVAKQNQ
jgi:hypothetical protein